MIFRRWMSIVTKIKHSSLIIYSNNTFVTIFYDDVGIVIRNNLNNLFNIIIMIILHDNRHIA
jgi:hypothetical protein